MQSKSLLGANTALLALTVIEYNQLILDKWYGWHSDRGAG